MEETQNHRQSPSVWGSTQDLTRGISMMRIRKVRDQSSTTQEELVNDLKRQLGPQVTMRAISNTLHREGLKSCCARKVPLLKKAYVQARLKFA